MEDIEIDRGERVDIRVDDTESARAKILVAEEIGSSPIISVEAEFVDGSAQITLLNEHTDIEDGDYVYQIRLFDEDDEYFNLKRQDCTEDCEVGLFKVCPIVNEGS